MKHRSLGAARRSHTALLLIVLLGTYDSGCDLFDPGGPLYAGIVVDAATGEAIEGIQVSL